MDAVGHDGGHEQARRWGLVVVVFACACAVLVACLLVYSAYMNRLLYNERLDQMKGVTVQLFQGLEDNIDDRWADVEVRSGRLLSQHPHTVAELCAYIAQQDEIIDASAKNEAGIIAVDDKGCFYSAQGQGGPLRDMDVLVGQPERISYISNDTMSAKTCMVLLSMLAEPVVLDDGTRILYYGSRLPIEQLSPYFECKAYEGTSSVYLLGTDGTKIFFDGSGELIHGFNAFSVLKQMHYSHGSTFDDALRALNETGTAYSNAVLEGTEYYYALRRIEGTEWTVLFLVPSSSVATNTVHLVELNTNTMLVFAVIAVVATTAAVAVMMRLQRSREIAVERANALRLEEANEMLRRANEAARDAFEAAESANRSKSDFLANMSHDIRTPMNAIVGFAELIRANETDPARVDEYVMKIQASSNHLLSLINDVLDMSKIEAGKMNLHISRMDVSEVVGAVVDIIRPQAEACGLHFDVSVAGIEGCAVKGDSLRLRQILLNILSNAVKYTPSGGRVSFAVRALKSEDIGVERISFTVADNGIGMTPEFQKVICDPFTRQETSRTNKVQGTGLGMAITRSFVDMMGGTMSIASEVGKGSTVEVVIPFEVAGNADSVEPVRNSGMASGEGRSVLAGMRFLCAEDNELNAEILQALLNLAGAQCKICENGRLLLDAFEAAKPGDFDAILMDVQMPVMNGYEATRAIRASKSRLAGIPIVAMTANAFSEDVRDALDAGMNAHVAKPLDMEVLAETLRSLGLGARDGE